MSEKVDLTGQPFGQLIVREEFGRDKQGKALWLCDCSCGNETVVRGHCLRSGHTLSCGCLKLEKLIERSTKHGVLKFNPRLYYSVHSHFDGIRKGVRGFQNWTLDPRYSDNAEGVAMFCNDLIALQPEACARYEADKTLVLDKDNNSERIFRPEDCHFVSERENNNNRRNTVRLEDGTSLAMFCTEVGIETKGENGNPSKQYNRIREMYRTKGKAHPELIQKANEYLTLLKRLQASLNLLAEVREFRHEHKIRDPKRATN